MVNFEFVTHGVPNGQDSWGSAVDDKYFETFYNIAPQYKGAQTVFVVEIRKNSSKYYAYYSYIRSQNIMAKSGRPGSYFGMTLKMDGAYCTDVGSLYRLLDTIYHKKIVGTIIEKLENAEKYLIASFSDAETTLNGIADLVSSQIKSHFHETDFNDLDSSISKRFASEDRYFNLNDIDSESFFNATKSYGKIFISSAYATIDELINSVSSKNKELTLSKSRNEDEIEELKLTNSSLRNSNASLTRRNEELQALADSKSDEIRTLKHEIDRLRDIETAYYSSEKESYEPVIHRHRHRSFLEKYHNYIIYGAGLLILIVSVLVIWSKCAQISKLKTAKTETEKQLCQCIKECDSLQNIVSIKELSMKPQIKIYRDEEYKEQVADSDILIPGNKYYVVILNAKKNGKLLSESFRVQSDSDSSATIFPLPVHSDQKREISYCVEDQIEQKIVFNANKH